ncbi:uncharacterized protein LOC111085766 [Limulus polyphemus]|uniref:Uncharacterized protein LOC111085766 n=1 Tax=Limulus polyphemus TaxID=6850 RepID=A0ABM1SDD2_LIMPO|nr:uncharacterized protein LOC111085766 [Limulus polyphemus]
MVLLLPFIVPMLIGRTLDVRKFQIGPNIYNEDDYKDIQDEDTTSTYHIIESPNELYNLLEIPLDVALYVKAGLIQTEVVSLGLDLLLKDIQQRKNTIYLCIIVKTRTVKRGLLSGASLLERWKELDPRVLGTHYCSSLEFGGRLLVLAQIQTNHPADFIQVKKMLTDNIGESGPFSDSIAENWLHLEESLKKQDLRGEVKLSMNSYSTSDTQSNIELPGDLLRLVKDFPSKVRENGIGDPMIMTLEPLTSIDSSFPDVRQEMKTEDLKLIISMFDDLRYTKSNLNNWIVKIDEPISENEEYAIAALLDQLNNLLDDFYQLISETTLYNVPDRKFLENTIYSYNIGLPFPNATYQLAYLRLKEHINVKCEAAFRAPIKTHLMADVFETVEHGTVTGGLEGCKDLCFDDVKCRSIGYGENLQKFDEQIGNWVEVKNLCWVYFRSTVTTSLKDNSELIFGDLFVYDRICYS